MRTKIITETLSDGQENGIGNVVELFGQPQDFLPDGYVSDEAKR